MPILFTAIIHLRGSIAPELAASLSSALRTLRGIDSIDIQPAESLITMQFDHEQTGLAEIVRAIEDAGVPVAGVAQRRSSGAQAVM